MNESKEGIALEDESLAKLSAVEMKEYTAWYRNLQHDRAWWSFRVKAIIEIVMHSIQHDPEAKIIVVDDFVYWLDIVEVGLSLMDDPHGHAVL